MPDGATDLHHLGLYQKAYEKRIQPLNYVDGVLRFKENKIVSFLLDNGGYDLNRLHCMNFSDEDWEQFNQLHGYSVDGWFDISKNSEETKDLVTQLEAKFLKENDFDG